MIYEVALLVTVMLINEERGGFRATCGEGNGLCVPNHECLNPLTGSCNDKQFCCKNSKYRGLPPPEGDCICVSEARICGEAVKPYRFLHRTSECGCCECTETCVALSENGLCPTFELPIGDCEKEVKLNCCAPKERKQPTLCKCFKDCPSSWIQNGTCKNCCLP